MYKTCFVCHRCYPAYLKVVARDVKLFLWEAKDSLVSQILMTQTWFPQDRRDLCQPVWHSHSLWSWADSHKTRSLKCAFSRESVSNPGRKLFSALFRNRNSAMLLNATQAFSCQAWAFSSVPQPWSLWWEMDTQESPGVSITLCLVLLTLAFAESQWHIWQTFTWMVVHKLRSLGMDVFH